MDIANNVYVVDHNNHRIRKITTDGIVSTIAGNGVAGFADGRGTAAMFNSPCGMALDAHNNLIIADYQNHR